MKIIITNIILFFISLILLVAFFTYQVEIPPEIQDEIKSKGILHEIKIRFEEVNFINFIMATTMSMFLTFFAHLFSITKDIEEIRLSLNTKNTRTINLNDGSKGKMIYVVPVAPNGLDEIIQDNTSKIVDIIASDHPQDLLLSPSYLEYFFKTPSDTSEKIKIIVVKKTEQKYISFLISYLKLCWATDYKTFLINKEKYKLLRNEENKFIQNIFTDDGNPSLLFTQENQNYQLNDVYYYDNGIKVICKLEENKQGFDHIHQVKGKPQQIQQINSFYKTILEQAKEAKSTDTDELIAQKTIFSN